MGHYLTAEVCPNGHVTTARIEETPERREQYCSRCGEATMNKCPNCERYIRGEYEHDVGAVFISEPYDPPAYCFNCGEPFPWTERRISTAVELLEQDGNLSADEIAQFRSDLAEMANDSLHAQVASNRFNQFMRRVGSSAATGVRDLVVDIASETALKYIERAGG